MSRSNFRNCHLLIVNGNSIEHRKVKDIFDGVIEADKELIPEENCVKFFNNQGGLTYLVNVDLPAKVEAENLKRLRRSVALARIFEYDRGKGINFMSLVPYIIIVLMIMFGR